MKMVVVTSLKELDVAAHLFLLASIYDSYAQGHSNETTNIRVCAPYAFLYIWIFLGHMTKIIGDEYTHSVRVLCFASGHRRDWRAPAELGAD